MPSHACGGAGQVSQLPQAAGLLAEVGQHLRPAALRRLAQREHRVQVRGQPPPVRLVAGGGVDQPALLHHVGQAVGEPRGRRQPVPPGPAGLLVVALDRTRHVQVGHEADVRLVDAHPERDRGHHDQAVLAQEACLVGGAGTRVEPRVVRQRRYPLAGQELGRLVHRRPGQAVHDAGFARVLRAQQVQQLPARLVLQHDPVGDVRPVEAGDEVARAAQVEPGGDLGPGGLGRRRGQGDPRHVRPPLVQRGQFEVIGPEVVPPLGHAVRLVDREQRDPAAIEQPHRRFGPQPLRRQVEQVQLARQERRLDPPPLARLLGRVEEPGPHAQRGQRVHLVLHQRDERRDDHAGAVPDERRDLVAQRLAAAGRHEHERVAAAGDVVDDLPLPAPERLVPEHPPQDLQRPVRHCLRVAGNCCHAAILRSASVSVGPGATPRNPPNALRAPRWYVADTPATHRAQGPVRWASMSASP